jgi:hypothetical protein
MKTEPTEVAKIFALAGRALFICQNVEYYLTLMCRMLSTAAALAPKADLSLFGLQKERTASLQTIQKELKRFGVDSEHYLNAEIDEFVKRRDWLAHRVYIDIATTREETRAIQKRCLEELNERAFILLGVIVGVTKLIAESQPDVERLPDHHLLSRLCKNQELESSRILKAMTKRVSLKTKKRS